MTAPYYKLAGVLAAPGFVTERLLAPGRLRCGAMVLTAADAVSAAVAAAVRVVSGIHNDTSN